MKAHLIRNVIIVILGLIVIGGAWFAVKANRMAIFVEPPTDTTSTGQATSTNEASTMTVKVALLDYTGEKPGKQRGCDHVILVDRTVPSTPAPLTAALTELFGITEAEVDGLGNFIPRTRDTLGFDRVTIENGVARVYLLGKLSGLAGVCDDPRAKIQIEETALQFPTVKSVQLYLNGEKTDLQPSEK